MTGCDRKGKGRMNYLNQIMTLEAMPLSCYTAYDMFSWYTYLSVNLVFPIPRFMEWDYLSDCAISGSLPNCTFLNIIYEGGSESSVIGVITLLIDIIGCCIMP